MLFSLLAFLFSLIGLMLLIKSKLHILPNLVPFVSTALMLFILYIAAVLGFLFEISIIIYSIGLISFIYNIYVFIKIDRADNNSNYSISNLSPLILFGVLFFFNWVVFRSHIFTRWDEYSFWGYFIKILTFNHDFIGEYVDINKIDYPRITSIWQYYFNLFLSRSKFNEGITIFAQVTIFASVLPTFVQFKKGNFIYSTIISVAFYCLPFVFVLPIYLIYVDSVLGIFLAMSIILYLSTKNNRKGVYLAMIPLICMPQIKEIGVVFAILGLGTIFIHYIYISRFKEIFTTVKIFSLSFFLILASLFSWKAYLYYQDVDKTSFTLSVSDVNTIDPDGYQKEVLTNYMYSLSYIGNVNTPLESKSNPTHLVTIGNFSISDKLNSINKVLNTNFYRPGPDRFYEISLSLSPLYWAIIFVAFSLSLYIYSARADNKIIGFKNRMHYSFFISTIIASLISYIILLLFLYLVSFSPYEAVRLASFDRYIGSFLLAMFVILLYILTISDYKFLVYLFCVLIFAFTPGSSTDVFAPRHTLATTNYMMETQRELDPIFQKIRSIKEDAKIYLIDQGSNGSFHKKFNYYAFPNDVANKSSINISKKLNEQMYIVSLEEFQIYLKKCDFLVVWRDHNFWEVYGDIVKNSNLKGVYTMREGKWISVVDYHLIK